MNKIILIICMVVVLLAGFIVMNQAAETTSNFDVNDINTWPDNGGKVIEEVKKDSNKVNSVLAQASVEQKNSLSYNIVNQGRESKINIVGFGSSDLLFDKDGFLTNGNSKLDLRNIPNGVNEVIYNEKEKAFTFKTEKGSMEVKQGTLNEDMSYTVNTGTLHLPDDKTEDRMVDVKWNGLGEVKQTGKNTFELSGDAKFNVGNLDVDLNKESGSVKFFTSDFGDLHVLGTNLDIKFDEISKVSFPEGVETEFFVGPGLPIEAKESYVKIDSPKTGREEFLVNDERGNPKVVSKGNLFSEDSLNRYNNFVDEDIKLEIVGEDISLEFLTDSPNKEAKVNGENIIIKNQGVTYEIKGAENAKGEWVSQISFNHVPEKGHNMDVINLQNEDASVYRIRPRIENKDYYTLTTSTPDQGVEDQGVKSANGRYELVPVVGISKDYEKEGKTIKIYAGHVLLDNEYANLPSGLSREDFLTQIAPLSKGLLIEFGPIIGLNEEHIVGSLVKKVETYQTQGLLSKSEADELVAFLPTAIPFKNYKTESLLMISGTGNSPTVIGSSYLGTSAPNVIQFAENPVEKVESVSYFKGMQPNYQQREASAVQIAALNKFINLRVAEPSISDPLYENYKKRQNLVTFK
ncbi:MAG: hypothetical protein ABIH37_02950 [archaeon]